MVYQDNGSSGFFVPGVDPGPFEIKMLVGKDPYPSSDSSARLQIEDRRCTTILWLTITSESVVHIWIDFTASNLPVSVDIKTRYTFEHIHQALRTILRGRRGEESGDWGGVGGS
jgi:hypothetical protein